MMELFIDERGKVKAAYLRIMTSNLQALRSANIPCKGSQVNYVTNIVANDISTHILATSSDHSITIYDYNTLKLLNTFKAHLNTINDIKQFDNSFTWLSCASDKTLRRWDTRINNTNTTTSNNIIHKIKNEILSFDISLNNTLLSLTNGNSIDFLDLRMISSNSNNNTSFPSTNIPQNTLESYEYIHTDIITQLQFTPYDPTLLASSSEDGLICIHDTKSVHEDDVTISTMNTDCPVRKFGFFGTTYEGIYSLSTVETMTLWHSPSAQLLLSYPSIRSDYTIDYLVDCHYYSDTDQLTLLGGTYEGVGKVIPIRPEISSILSEYTQSDLNTTLVSNQPVSKIEREPTLATYSLNNGHTDVIRCCFNPYTYSQQCNFTQSVNDRYVLHEKGHISEGSSASVSNMSNNTYLITGGEDSKICIWSL